MGTVCYQRPANVREDLINSLTGDNGVHAWRVLDIKMNLRTAYAAVERVTKATGERQVTAVVLLLTYVPGDTYYNFCVKEIDECMGPYEDRCPASILDLLTEAPNDYARQWRERCRANLAAPKRYALRIGSPTAEPAKRYATIKAAFRNARKLASGGDRAYVTSPSQSWQVYGWGGWSEVK